MTSLHRLARVVLFGALLAAPTPAFAQLDPLLFLKTPATSSATLSTSVSLQPNVILAVDTSQRMQFDVDGTYYDPGTYARTLEAYEEALGLAATNTSTRYHRKYLGFRYQSSASTDKYGATKIEAVGDTSTSAYTTFYERTRLALARRGLVRAITNNSTNTRFALVKTRQTGLTLPSAGNDSSVLSDDSAQQLTTEIPLSTWKVTRTTVTSDDSASTSSGLLTSATASGANNTILTTLNKSIGTAGALLPAGHDSYGVVDSPVGLLLDDARSHASTLVSADSAAGGCRNTIVVLVVGGGEGTISPQDLTTKAATFLNVGGRRVPIYVVALFPTAVDATALEAIATASGGQYFEITKALVDATTVGDPVPEIARAVNTAIQHALVPSTTFNTAPTTALPFGPYGESQVTSPILGTVNLRGASKLTSSGTEVLPDSETYILNGTAEIPQRSNVMVTSSFMLPGFEGMLRAFRVYRPVADATKASGYKFTQDGTRLWVSSVPAAGSRNIFTVLPGSSTLVPFTTTEVNSLDDYLGVTDPSTLIDWVRSQPLGALVGSTPAFLDPPSLDPPPDDDYPAFREANADRRSLVIVGANDGMLHAFDARTGIEVWAFIPFNLLPKLRALRYGQPIENFAHFVDSSPKISDVKVGDDWRTYLFFGQGPGGTFYNTLDMTLDGINDVVSEESTSDSAVLTYFSDASRIAWKWSFPRNTVFNHALSTYGELDSSATNTEKTVGETWSDPAIGQLQDDDGPYVMIVGSGFLKHSIETAYRTGVTRAGTTFYVLDVATGDVLGTPRDVGADAYAETVDNCHTAGDCRKIKNALQMDPVATGPSDQRYITKAYIGDLDGVVWKFNLSVTDDEVSVSTPIKLYDAGAQYPLFSSMATVAVGSTNQYIFVGTGSDLLPSDSVNQSYSLLVILDNGTSGSKTAEILLESTNGSGNDEKVTAFPSVAGDIVFFTTTSYAPTTPCTPFSANLYAFTFIGGPAYDTNNDGSLSTGSTGGKGGGKKGGGSTSGDSTKVFSSAGVRATAPFIVDQHLVFSAGGKLELFGDKDDYNNCVGQAGVRILSWRLVR
jgi:hypothetical protein